MYQKIEFFIEKVIFNSRWLMAPFFLGLIVAIISLLIKFVLKLFYLMTHIMIYETHDVIVAVLSLVDMSLIGCLLLMIIFSGYEIFVSKIDVSDHQDKPEWMGKVNFGGLKLKVISAIVAISAIELLKSFVSYDTSATASASIMWKVIVHMTFVISGVFFALTEYISSKSHQ